VHRDVNMVHHVNIVMSASTLHGVVNQYHRRRNHFVFQHHFRGEQVNHFHARLVTWILFVVIVQVIIVVKVIIAHQHQRESHVHQVAYAHLARYVLEIFVSKGLNDVFIIFIRNLLLT